MEERRTDVLNDGIVGGGGVVANSVDVLKRLLILRVNLVVRLVVFVQESVRRPATRSVPRTYTTEREGTSTYKVSAS